MRQGLLWFIMAISGSALPAVSASNTIPTERWESPTLKLQIELPQDNIIHVWYTKKASTAAAGGIPVTPMVFKSDYPGAKVYERKEQQLTTEALKTSVDPETLCITYETRQGLANPIKICPEGFAENRPAMQIDVDGITHVYGLGQQFADYDQPNGDWLRFKERVAGNSYGNEMVPYGPIGGKVGNTQIPMLYGLGNGNAMGLFIDTPYGMVWDFKNPKQWKASFSGSELRYYYFVGKSLSDIRHEYLNLTGTPPIPPRKLFGLWVSEYGYDNWGEIDDRLVKLREHKIPVDGFVLDLQWFGGISSGTSTAMGNMNWDLQNFPSPQAKIAEYENSYIGLMAIEESYVGAERPAYKEFAEKNAFVYQRKKMSCPPLADQKPVELEAWWGKGSMIDWTDQAGADWWHDTYRKPNLIDMGIMGHWTDLGEPEIYAAESCYDGYPPHRPASQRTAHNFYNLFWSKSIYNGYVRHAETKPIRPFILSRSGTGGSQRYGVALWSGDIEAAEESLNSHFNAHMHVSLSGIDYYGSDTGGFWRDKDPRNRRDVYSLWLANAAWFDIPLRPHTYNVQNQFATSPAEVGEIASNTANIRSRYELIPYYYSLAYRAFLYGEPILPPPVYYFPDDPKVRELGDQKMLGKDLMIASFAGKKSRGRRVYLPAGVWIDYRTHRWYQSQGQQTAEFEVVADNGMIALPVFARAGAIIPQQYIDEHTLDSAGHRRDNSNVDMLIASIFPGPERTQFTLYEDDGSNINFDAKQRPIYTHRSTLITQEVMNDTPGTADIIINIEAAEGSYPGASEQRNNWLKVSLPQAGKIAVKLNNEALKEAAQGSPFLTLDVGWALVATNQLWIKTGVLPVNGRKQVHVSLQY
jgi:alpha-glucosidase (family GH31 glycosyl hydrolase)